jgi:hypothetical protein
MLSHAHPELQGAEHAVFVDESRRYSDCSEGACRLVGYSRAEMLKRRIDDLSFDDREVSKLFAQYLRDGMQKGEYVLRHKNGAPVAIRYESFVFADGCKAAKWEPDTGWKQAYLEALYEFDPKRLKERTEKALAAMNGYEHEQRGKESREKQALRDARFTLEALRRTVK